MKEIDLVGVGEVTVGRIFVLRGRCVCVCVKVIMESG